MIIQALWHLSAFRDRFLALDEETDHVCRKNSGGGGGGGGSDDEFDAGATFRTNAIFVLGSIGLELAEPERPAHSVGHQGPRGPSASWRCLRSPAAATMSTA